MNMHFKKTRSLLLILCLWTILVDGQANARANAPPKEEPGHNKHQEYVIFACLSVTGILIALVVLILWFLVDRTKEQIRTIDKIMPEILMNHRRKNNARDEEEMFGTLTAHTELEYKRMTSTESNNRNSVELTGFRKYGTSSSAVASDQLDVDRFEIDSDVHAMDIITVEPTSRGNNQRTLVGNTPPPYNSPPAYDNPVVVQVEENNYTNGNALQRNSLNLEDDARRKRYKKKYYESNL
ncbi:uncharacterized protein [Antedon mediterranea]|uniref:uncharacterized protein n=1 Tax=Antedon mediterranea TaxID=105859 RepID=UPI003AF5977A